MGGVSLSFAQEKKEMLYWAQLLNQKGFVTARSGNISYKVGTQKILITSHDCYLGYLKEQEILLVDLAEAILEGNRELTSEKDLHVSIHRHFKGVKAVMHAHPPYTTAFFHYFDKLDIFSFEAKFYLGNITVIPQATPTVTDIEPVLGALENSNIVVLGAHGVVSIGRDFKEASSLIELLEEQAKVNLIVQAQGRNQQTDEVIQDPRRPKTSQKYKLLSKEHIAKLVEVINSDQQVQELGAKYDLTCTLAVKNQDTNESVCFHYEKGKIIKTTSSDSAEFVIIGKENVLSRVFNRQIDPFVASTQGKVKTKGDFSKMSKWYPVLVKTFQLWEQAPVE
ncbi:MAG: class II aldolase/adducin family protein [Candidatus Omnitrophota bacterium]|nr:MAG: class II aldolase/adducin family protein [Candidatus Omnitrophota bacterium]